MLTWSVLYLVTHACREMGAAKSQSCCCSLNLLSQFLHFTGQTLMIINACRNSITALNQSHNHTLCYSTDSHFH